MLEKSKIIKIILIFSILFCMLSPIIYADDYDEEIDLNFNSEIESEQTLQTTAQSSKDLSINSRSAVVIDRNSNTIIFGKNEKNKVKMASTTKIMTSIVVIENSNLSDVVEVSKKSAGTGGSRLGLKTGDKLTVQDLLYGLMLCSGNDSAVALAEHVGGSIEGFAELMNKKAQELNLTNSHFVTPHGLDADEHYTTAYELAILSNYALKNKIFAQIVGTKSYTVTINGSPKSLLNTNELLGNLNGVYGIKTGFTNGANRCLVTVCKRNNLDIICVVLGADTKKFRTNDSIKLIEYTFSNFELFNIKSFMDEKFNSWEKENIDNFTITKGKSTKIDLDFSPLSSGDTIPIKKDLIKDLKVNITCNFDLNAPVYENDIIGKLELISNDEVLVQCDIIVNNTIDKKNFENYLYELFKSYPSLLENFIN